MRTGMTPRVDVWTNASVRTFAGQDDPVEAVRRRAREVVLKAMDQGWSGPPFDPIALSGLLGIPVFPRADIRDARTVPQRDGVRLEYNPTRPRGRLRYSVAHEIAHTLFKDCSERIRNRSAYHELQGDDWQLEVLCNIAAAEFLMPVGSIQPASVKELSIDRTLAMRSEYDVSTEAILIRLAHISDRAFAAFVASRIEQGARAGRYRLDYAIPSQSWTRRLGAGTLLSDNCIIQQCTAIGYTAKGDDTLPSGDKVHIECVGIPPYPGSSYPRVAGLMTGTVETTSRPSITYVQGNALEPRGEGQKLIVHIVNDATPNWGGRGFAVGLKHVWPGAQREFRDWAEERGHLKLGQVHAVRVSDDLTVASMVAQKGYGPSLKPRIRYAALQECLARVADLAIGSHATVHMPRIATGRAGGSWFIVEELVTTAITERSVPVIVYDLPEGESTKGRQMAFEPSIE